MIPNKEATRREAKHSTTSRLRIFNHCLTVVVALIAAYIILAPFLPQLSWWLRHDAPSPIRAVVPQQQPPTAPNPIPDSPSTPKKSGIGTLTIPYLELQETIHGGGIGSLSKGVWHIPYTSTPDRGGNTVLAGHRFTYRGQAVFYHLDKLKTGMPITLEWQGKIYRYTVSRVMVVPPTAVEIEDNTKEPRLTLYTCTPVWSAKDRLVIQATLVGVQE